jgi:mitogen-activated protein kinase 1/3
MEADMHKLIYSK